MVDICTSPFVFDTVSIALNSVSKFVLGVEIPFLRNRRVSMLPFGPNRRNLRKKYLSFPLSTDTFVHTISSEVYLPISLQWRAGAEKNSELMSPNHYISLSSRLYDIYSQTSPSLSDLFV